MPPTGTAPVPSPAPSPTSTSQPSSSLGSLFAIGLKNAFPVLDRGDLGPRPVFVTSVPDDSGHMAVVEQSGKIFMLSEGSGSSEAMTFLDITDRVRRQGNEEGLLGLAFHPDYPTNGRFFVYYSASSPRRSVLSRFQVSGDPNRADAESEAIVLEVEQPFPNHNGGMIAFGPDGLLYVALGDGGSGGDPRGNGQNVATLLGSLLRIDVDAPKGDLGYAIPGGNPFPSGNARGEIWAYGLRNPWRFSFDRATGDLWLADVGQNDKEEINIVRQGGNYGWNVMEGADCFQPSSDCRREGLELPLWEYAHSLGCSVTGGYVYRGQAVPWLQGAYVYADFCSGFVWGLRYDGARVTEQALLLDSGLNISSCGEDAAGELYVTAFDGVVYRITG